MEETTNALHSSVLRLQKWNRILLGSVVILALVVIAGRVSESRIVRAQSIQLVSEVGKVLAELSVQGGFAHGGGVVALHGQDSKGAAVLYLKDEGSLRFFESEGGITNQVTARREEKEE